MYLQKLMTVENLLKVLLAIAVGVMLYKIFFGKETYYNYHGDKSGYAYPTDYEEDIDLTDAISSADSEEVDEEIEEVEEIEDVVDAEDDIYEYMDEENEVYDDSEEIVADVIEDAEEDVVDEENDEEDVVDEENGEVNEVNNFDMMYASDVEDGLQESFVLYSNLVGVDTSYA